MISNLEHQLFVPIIQWIDFTTVTGNDRFSSKPYMFHRPFSKKPIAAQFKHGVIMGFFQKKTSSAQNQTQTQGNNIRNYHAELYAVLHLFTIAGPQLCNIMLRLGPKGAICVDIITCILFVILDMQEGDALCGPYCLHTTGIQCHCCACNVSAAQLDNPNAICTFLVAANMA